jgi:PhoH-like ATPase
VLNNFISNSFRAKSQNCSIKILKERAFFMSTKTFVLDPYEILSDYEMLYSFGPKQTVVLTDSALDQLFKSEKIQNKEFALQAKLANEYINKLCAQGDLFKGVEQSDKSILRVEMNHKDITIDRCSENEYGYRLLQVCEYLKKQGKEVELITNTPSLSLRAKMLGIKTAKYRQNGVPELELQYKGIQDYYVSKEVIDRAFKIKGLHLDKTKFFDNKGELLKLEQNDFIQNQFVVLHCGDTMFCGYIDDYSLKFLKNADKNPFEIKAKNTAQRLAISALLEDVDNTPLVILKGPAGTAKTFLSLAAGLQQIEDKIYRKMLISRPAVKMDEDLGFLPGTESEKMAPYMRGIKDNLEALIYSNRDKIKTEQEKIDSSVDYYFEKGLIDVESIAYMRGRSIFNNYILIDEAQNLTISQAKAIATRVGEGTKIVLVGDPSQIDNPILNTRNNGLSYISEKFKGNKLCLQLSFSDSDVVRSKLAMEASKLL